MVIPRSGSYITIPMLKKINKKDKKAIYTIIRKKNLQSIEKEKNYKVSSFISTAVHRQKRKAACARLS